MEDTLYLPLEMQTQLPIYNVKQGDNGARSLKIYITLNGITVNIKTKLNWSKASLRIHGKNLQVFDSIEIEDSGAYLLNTFTAVQTSVAGRNYADIVGFANI